MSFTATPVLRGHPALVALGLALGGAACAQADADLARKYACLACHTVDRKVVGPAYKDVAQRYAGQKDAVDTLAASIRKGSRGKWGSLIMPPQARLSESDAQALAKWVLNGAK